MLLLAFSSNATPRIFFANARSSRRRPPTLLSQDMVRLYRSMVTQVLTPGKVVSSLARKRGRGRCGFVFQARDVAPPARRGGDIAGVGRSPPDRCEIAPTVQSDRYSAPHSIGPRCGNGETKTIKVPRRYRRRIDVRPVCRGISPAD